MFSPNIEPFGKCMSGLNGTLEDYYSTLINNLPSVSFGDLIHVSELAAFFFQVYLNK
jgi:hypothetical protein